MDKSRDLLIYGIGNDIPETVAAVCRSRILTAVNSLLDRSGIEDIKITVGTPSLMQEKKDCSYTPMENTRSNQARDNDELLIEERSRRYKAQTPIHTLDKLAYPDDIQTKIDFEIEAISALSIVHEQLNYKVIKPIPRRGLILAGEPGTGKTALAHAIASKLGIPILTVTYADIASKFHGEGPQNLKAVFYAAQRDKALLHIEEADALSSQRLAEVNSGAEQAINSLRNQLFSCLDQYPVLTICTTNFVDSFDKALETRLRLLQIPMPDQRSRHKIWSNCLSLPGRLQLADDVSIDKLAEIEDVCGREITDAVEDAALKTVLKAIKLGKNPEKELIEQNELLSAIEAAKSRRYTNQNIRGLTPIEEQEVSERIQIALTQDQRITEHYSLDDIKFSKVGN